MNRGDFFKGVVQWDIMTPDMSLQGKLPVFYYDNTSMTAIYTAATDRVRKLLPLPDMHPVEAMVGRALVAFTAFEAAYYAEIIRAGMNSVSRGQNYAALALGMTKSQTLTYVILPQAFRVMTPLLLTQGVILFQDTALVYIIGLADFFRTATNIGKTTGYEIEMVLFAGAGYFVVCFCVSLAVTVVKKRLKL